MHVRILHNYFKGAYTLNRMTSPKLVSDYFSIDQDDKIIVYKILCLGEQTDNISFQLQIKSIFYFILFHSSHCVYYEYTHCMYIYESQFSH